MNSQQAKPPFGPFTTLFVAVLTAAAAGGMGWGIRGQYGHETGAMIAGALTSLCMVMLLAPGITTLRAARAAAMMTVAIGIGGQMTYGQTVGLTHDAEVVGNWEALRWGMIGLAVKGGIWIGFGALFLGMGLGEIEYRAREIVALFVAMMGLALVGVWIFNTPYDPAAKELPWIYFSDDWYFEPGRALKPRRETWGGLLVALLACGAYTRFVRQDRLAGRMMLIGMVAGGLGFPGGQCVQASHAWNPGIYSDGLLSQYSEYFQYFNWWNMMETTFGMIFGGVLAGGLWLNRGLVRGRQSDEVSIMWPVEIVLLLVHLGLLLGSEFLDTDGLPAGSLLRYVSLYTDHGLLMCVLPIACIVGGRIWPILLLLPVVTAPIVGKTVRALAYQGDSMTIPESWAYLIVPMVIMFRVAVYLLQRQKRNPHEASASLAIALAACTICFFGLNTRFFNYPWPWTEWTGRTPNQIIFGICAIVLLMAAEIVVARSSRGTHLYAD